MHYIIARLKEPSTWAGLLAIIGPLLSWQFAPEQAAAISTGFAALAGAILASTKSHGASD